MSHNALKVLAAHGAVVGRDYRMVGIQEEMVQQASKIAPKPDCVRTRNSVLRCLHHTLFKLI